MWYIKSGHWLTCRSREICFQLRDRLWKSLYPSKKYEKCQLVWSVVHSSTAEISFGNAVREFCVGAGVKSAL
jgi:hypothetical protein